MNYDDDALTNCSPEEQVKLLQAALKKEQLAHRREQQAHMNAQERIRYLTDLLTGRKTEKREQALAEQPDFFNEVEQLVDEQEDATEEVVVRKRKKRGGGRQRFSDALTRIETTVDIEAHEKTCACGCQREAFSQEVSEKLVMTPAQFHVERLVRPKYRCPSCEEGVKIAPPAPQFLPKSYADESLLAQIILSKYQDALPLARQEKIFKRLGVYLPRNTMARWIMESAQRLEAFLKVLERILFQAPVMLMDETRVQVNKELGRAAHHLSQMWVRRSSGPPDLPQVVLFHYNASRSGQVATELLEGFQGAVVSDGYAAYQTAQKKLGFEHGYCMAHARRYFVEAEKITKAKKTSFIAQVLGEIQKLFAIEEAIKGKAAEEKVAIRQARSKPVLDKLRGKLETKISKSPCKGSPGKAIHYMLNNWEGLTQYLNNGHMPMHNNGAENAIRPFTVGRKNWMFADTPRGAHASATFYSIIETAKANGHEPWRYLTYLLKQMAHQPDDEQLEQLMPWNVDPASIIDVVNRNLA